MVAFVIKIYSDVKLSLLFLNNPYYFPDEPNPEFDLVVSDNSVTS